MPHALFVTQTHNVWGGMEQWLHHFSLALSREGWKVSAALPRGGRFNDPDAYLAAHPHLDASIVDARAASPKARAVRLADVLVSRNPDVVLPIASGAIFDAVALARRDGWQGRFVLPIRSLHPDLICNAVDSAAHIDRVVVVSRLLQKVVTQLLPNESVRYVRHGVRPATRRRSPADRLRIGFVGRLEESTKRVSDLVRLCEKVSGRGLPIDFHVFGDGPDAVLLERRAASLPGLHLHGAWSQDDLYERGYPNLDVIVLFSPAEGSPNAVYEAMQHGVVPVVSQYRGQRPEGIVRDGENGWTFPVGDVDAAVSRVVSLAHDRALLERLSDAAAREVVSDTDERMHRDWLAILDEVLANPAKPLPAGWTVAFPPSGKLEAVAGPRLSQALRRLVGRGGSAQSGWDEWPGTAPADPDCIRRVLRLIEDLDR